MVDVEAPGAEQHVTPEKARNTDLPTRIGSAAVMVALAGVCLWRGGVLLDLFIAVVAGAAYWEWQRLVRRMGIECGFSRLHALVWVLAGAAYIGAGAALMIAMPALWVLFAVLVVAFIDSCAYFAGRTIGGPKIAPRISPSKTWAGLGGGVVGAGLAILLFLYASHWITVGIDDLADGTALHTDVFVVFGGPELLASTLAAGAILAVLAQAGDFFESWMKRRARVKDSSTLIPGHGGVFDRIDGLLPVAILLGVLAQLAL